MVARVLPSRRCPLLLLLLAAIIASGCMPGSGAASPTPLATAAVAATLQPAPSDNGVTAGEPRPSPSVEPTPTRASVSSPTPAPVVEADPEPFAMNLYRNGDFVAQYTFEWCVGASLQMALNMATDDSRTTRADQQLLWEMARDRSFSPFGGANPRGWTASLNDLGIGPYVLVSLPSFDEALNAAAEALRATRRPVGLVMWRGRHAWVMSGFEATADPRRFDDFEVTGIRVLDPLYPHGSSVWGPSAKPNSLVSPATLAKQYVLRDSTRVNLGVPPGYLLILPVVAGT
jgi:hypothetical protein